MEPERSRRCLGRSILSGEKIEWAEGHLKEGGEEGTNLA